MKTLFSYRSCVVSVPVFFCVFAASAQTVNREPPPIYGELLEKELTPLDPLLKEIDYFSPEKSDHGCVMQENVVYVDDEGRTYEVFQLSYKALSNGDLDDIGSDIFSYRPETDKIYLICAETILPDGSVRSVPPEGAMIQAPQSDEDSMIFSGRKQLRIIYPQVSEGSVTHCIVLKEHESSRIPGKYMDQFAWGRSWQMHLKRAVVSLPKSYASKLNAVVLGDGIPAPKQTVSEDGRVRYEWVQKKLPVRKWEYLDGPVTQTGPALFLSTLEGWDDLANWYAERIRESSVVDDAVREVAKEWAGETEDEDEIIYNLAFRVANDIRYVSLEFGVGGLQPQPVSSVLENRFGDCKDKANFLRVLLKEHGIKSCVSLISTEHAGRVEKRCADYSYFNHAILWIEKSNGETLFCDPTVKYGSAGMLYPAIANRPALVIDQDSSTCRWVQTPQASAGTLDYQLDMKLSQTGELSGWFTLKAVGYYAAALSRRFEATDRDSLKYEVERYVGYFYDASSVIDFEIERATPDQQEFLLKSYLIRPATGQARLSVGWPSIKWLLPRLGEDKEVEREAFIWSDKSHVRLKIELPESLMPTSLPDDWSIRSAGFEAQGNWTGSSNVLQADFYQDIAQTHIAPSEFPKLFNAVDASRHWLEKMVILGASGEKIPERAAPTSSGQLGDDFMLMSTGDGQVELIDHLYPSNTRPEERKLALEKTKSWFPKDQETQFNCDVRLGWLAYDREEYQKSIDIARTACREYGDAVSISLRGWARYLEAMALEEVGEVEESRSILLDLEVNPEMNEYRRAFGAYQYARMMSEEDPETAIAYYRKAFGYVTYDEEWMLGRCYEYLLDHMATAEWKEFLEEMYSIEPDRAKSMVIWLGGLGLDGQPEADGLTNAARIYDVLSAVDFAATALDASALDTLKELHDNFQNYSEGRAALKQYLSEAQFTFWQAAPDKERDFDAFQEDIDQAIGDDDIDLSARLALWRILNLDPTVDFPTWIWDAARMLDYLYKNDERDLEPLLSFVFDLRKYLPPDATGAIDLQFVQTESLEREGHIDEALAIYQALHDQGLKEEWWSSFYTRWPQLLISSGQMDKAVEILSMVRSHLKEAEDYLPICIQGIYVLLEQGKTDDALNWIREISTVCDLQGWTGENVDHVEQWIELDDAGQLDAFWELSKTWWPSWKQAAIEAGFPTNQTVRLAVFNNLQETGREIGEAIVREDKSVVAERLEQMMIGAKWHPYLCIEAQTMIAYIVKYYEAAETPFYQCELDLNSESYQLNPTNRYSARLHTLEALMKLEKYDSLVDLAETYFNDSHLGYDAEVYCRYGALGVINLNQAGSAWLGRMEVQLEKAEYRTDPYAVNIMSLLYRLEGQSEDEQTLLQRFLTEYKGDNEKFVNVLKARLKQSLKLSEGNRNLSEALAEWVDSVGPAWLAFLPDPELDQEDAALVSRKVTELDQREDDLKYSEIKYLLCAAMDERLDISTRDRAFFAFLISAMGPPWMSRHNMDMMASVVSDERFSSSLRDLCANFAVSVVAATHVPNYLETQLLPYLSGLDSFDDLEEYKDRLVEFANLDGFSAPEIARWMGALRESGVALNRRNVYLLKTAFSDLCRLGAVDLAQQQIKKANGFRFDSDAGSSSFALQFAWQQELDFVKDLMPIHAVWEDFYRKKLAASSVDKPVYSSIVLNRISGFENRQSANRALLQYGVYDHSSMLFWQELNHVEYLNGIMCVDKNNLGDLMDSLLGVCKTDRQYSMTLSTISQCFDSDDPDCVKIFTDRTESLWQNPDLSRTSQFLLWHRYYGWIRSGEYQRARVDLQGEKNLPQIRRHRLLMDVLLVSADHAALEDYLNTASPELLLDDNQLGNTLEAYRICGRDSVFEFMKDKGLECMREFMADAVSTGDLGAIHQALQLAGLLNAGNHLQGDWEKMVKQSASLEVYAALQMNLANFKEDWGAMGDAAQFLTEKLPSYYDNYFFLGKALIRQGKQKEGVGAMQPFLKYCKDSLYYREAQQLVEEVSAGR